MRLALPVAGGFLMSATLAGCGVSEAPVAQDRDPYLVMNKVLLDNGCSGCHAADYVRLGPPMTDVARLYGQATEGERAAVSRNIITGVAGKWGTSVMPPQDHISSRRADEILKVILSLDAGTKR